MWVGCGFHGDSEFDRLYIETPNMMLPCEMSCLIQTVLVVLIL